MFTDCVICLSIMMVKRFTEFGGTIPKRPVEDLAFGVARFIQKGGSYINYYMVISPCTNIMKNCFGFGFSLMLVMVM